MNLPARPSYLWCAGRLDEAGGAEAVPVLSRVVRRQGGECLVLLGRGVETEKEASSTASRQAGSLFHRQVGRCLHIFPKLKVLPFPSPRCSLLSRTRDIYYKLISRNKSTDSHSFPGKNRRKSEQKNALGLRHMKCRIRSYAMISRVAKSPLSR